MKLKKIFTQTEVEMKNKKLRLVVNINKETL